jgi:hypothetical protein
MSTVRSSELILHSTGAKSTRVQFAVTISADTAKWFKVVKDIGLVIQ